MPQECAAGRHELHRLGRIARRKRLVLCQFCRDESAAECAEAETVPRPGDPHGVFRSCGGGWAVRRLGGWLRRCRWPLRCTDRGTVDPPIRRSGGRLAGQISIGTNQTTRISSTATMRRWRSLMVPGRTHPRGTDGISGCASRRARILSGRRSARLLHTCSASRTVQSGTA